MAKRINNRRYNKLLSYRNNYYALGAQMHHEDDPYGLQEYGIKNDPYRLNGRYSTPAIVAGMGGAQKPTQSYRNPNYTDPANLLNKTSLLGSFGAALKEGFKSGALNGAATAVGGMVGGAIGGGLESDAGNAISSLSNIASAIPGPWGAVAGAGLNVLGGLTNRVFGSKLNQENINAANATINRLNNFQSNASSFDTLADTWGTTSLGTNFSNSYIGKDGWFSNKAKKKANELRDKINLANAFVENSLQNNADNLTETTMNNLEANYAAFGGGLNTAGANFPIGLTFINEGGTHESNPYEGVPMGVDPNGKPNLVEEGEAIYNDYVFSNRLTVPKTIRSKYKLRGNKDLTFADAVKQLSKGATERPNDSISQETLHEIMSDLAQTQEGIRKEAQQNNKFNDGGNMDNGGFTYKPYKYVAGYNGKWFDANGKYIQDYLDKVNKMGIADINNAFNEQYKFYMNDANKDSDRWKAIDAFYKANPQYKVANTNLTEAALPIIRKLATDGKPGFMHQFFNDATPINRANRYFLRGKDAQGNFTVTPMEITPWEGYASKGKYEGRTFAEAFPKYAFIGKQERPMDKGTIYTDYYYDENKDEEEKEEDDEKIDLGTSNESLRYVPAIGLGLASITDAMGLTNKPDYGEASMIEASTRGGSYMPVAWNPIGNKLTYRPFDRDYYTNKLNAESGATRRAIANQSGGNSGRTIAGLLAADYNAQDKLGDLFRKSEEYNLEQRQKVEDFNRATNQANSQGMLQADMANQQAYNSARDFNLRGIIAAAEMRQKARLAAEQAKSANLSGFLQALGDIGYENKGLNMIRRYIETGAPGGISADHPLFKLYATSKAKRNKGKRLTDK